ncbi:autotransporter domain-containing protein, partial [Synechococcus sp. UW140]|uniref:autotransporter domain-containing protein n=1 Tax=Synechococcus sp. UW140 TaxID=368503 RepID=UPI0010BDFFAE
TFIPRLSLGYAWDLGDTNRTLTARFNSSPKGSFSVDGTPAPSSWFNVGLGLDVAINDRFSVYLNGRGQLSPSSTQSINYGGGFRWSF